MATALWVRAALRLPVAAFACYFLSHGVLMEGRSPEFPDGTGTLWELYSVLEGDSLVWQLLGVRFGPGGAMTAWVVGYPAVTALYAALGLLVLRGSRGVDRAVRLLMWLGLCTYGLALALAGILATHGFDSLLSANAGVYPYFGQRLVEAYRWLLLPWAVTLLAVTVTVLLLGRSASTWRRATSPALTGDAP
jgi:multisubunit Na+/H+ antiporter MnhB subunit